MKLNIEKFKTDPKLEKNGVPFLWGGVTWIVRRCDSKTTDHAKSFQKELNLFKIQYDGVLDQIDEAVTAKLNELTAKYLLAGWIGLVDEETEQEVPYTYENALSVLNDYPDLAVSIQNLSANRDRFLVNATETKKK